MSDYALRSRIAVISCSLMLPAPALFAYELIYSNPPPPSFSSSDPANPVKIDSLESVRKLGRSGGLAPGDVSVGAAISLKSKRRSFAAEFLELYRGADFPAAKDIRFNTGLIPGKIYVNDYDAIWVDYQEPPGSAPGRFVVRLDLSGAYAEKPIVATAHCNQLRADGEINAEAAAWLPKDVWYRFTRLLGRPPDERWRYFSTDQYTVIQRRLHRNLKDVSAMDLYFPPGIGIKNLNLRVSFEDTYGQGELVEIGSPESVVCTDQYQLWRVDLGNLIKERFPGKSGGYIQEIIVFVGKENAIGKGPPLLNKVVFLTETGAFRPRPSFPMQEPAGIPQFPVFKDLPARIDKVSYLTKRMIVDLAQLKGAAVVLKNGVLHVEADEKNISAGVRVKRVRFVKFRESRVPAFLLEGTRILRGWGGPILDASFCADKAEWPLIDLYVPIPEVYQKRSRSFPFRFLSDGEITKRISGRQLAVQSNGKWLELVWSIRNKLKGGTLFYLGFSNSAVSTTASVKVVYATGKSILLPLRAGGLVQIPKGGLVRELVYHIERDKKPLQVLFSEAVCFRSALLGASDAFPMKLPYSEGGPSQDGSPMATSETSWPEMRSMSDLFVKWEILADKRGPLEFCGKTRDPRKLLRGPVWEVLCPETLSRLATDNDEVFPVPSRWFEVTDFRVIPNANITKKQWLSFLSAPVPAPAKESGYLSKILKTLGALLFLSVIMGLRRKVNTYANARISGPPSEGVPQMCFWSVTAAVFLMIGFWKRGGQGEDYFFVIGDLSCAVAGRYVVSAVLRKLPGFFPSVSDRFFSASSSVYVTTFVGWLLLSAGSFAGGVTLLADQLAIIAYFSLALSVISAMSESRNGGA